MVLRIVFAVLSLLVGYKWLLVGLKSHFVLVNSEASAVICYIVFGYYLVLPFAILSIYQPVLGGLLLICSSITGVSLLFFNGAAKGHDIYSIILWRHLPILLIGILFFIYGKMSERRVRPKWLK